MFEMKRLNAPISIFGYNCMRYAVAEVFEYLIGNNNNRTTKIEKKKKKESKFINLNWFSFSLNMHRMRNFYHSNFMCDCK